ncbi:MAG: hypothetical protein CVU87_01190 [Firmicutes bacterium HGW-Firmicutes-12]|jgi:hypothetical protein|nr:MAG: hypothetical protein CVU87_01190 [Firmicutes bacterium HGW-Firmicutes-12]
MLTFTGVFAEVPINSKLIIPPQKPPMECILDSIVDVQITKSEVIDTPLLYPEGITQQLRKIIVTGNVKIKIKYSALVEDQQVHLAHFDVQFCKLLEWPDGPPQGTPIEIVPIVEKKVFLQEDERRIFKALLLRLEVYRK